MDVWEGLVSNRMLDAGTTEPSPGAVDTPQAFANRLLLASTPARELGVNSVFQKSEEFLIKLPHCALSQSTF